jgi:hypothetical protein
LGIILIEMKGKKGRRAKNDEGKYMQSGMKWGTRKN